MAENFTLRLPNYEGPLDVLLRLIEERELEVTAVSIATVADQFLQYMSAMTNRDPKTLSNFISVAARLIVLKSRAILPQLVRQETSSEDDGSEDDLIAQLKVYQLYNRTGKWLLQREAANLTSYPIHPPPIDRPKTRQLPLDNVTVELLARSMQRVVDRWMPPPPVDQVVSRLPFTVNDCIRRIEKSIAERPRMTFTEVLHGISLRVEIIISLLALLELLKRNVVVAYQDQAFGEIIIEQAPALEPELVQQTTLGSDEVSDYGDTER